MRETKAQKEREALNHIRPSNRSGSHANCIRISSNETYEHARAKFVTAYQLVKAGKTFWTEAIFLNGKRADVITLDGEIFEIICSETEEECKEKVKAYPEYFSVTMIKPLEVIK